MTDRNDDATRSDDATPNDDSTGNDAATRSAGATRNDAPRPTEPSDLPSDAELRVLRGLWAGGEQTVRELHERLSPEWDVGYTTILKLLQRMHEKGLVSRTAAGRAHVYRPDIREATAERRLVRDLAARAFGGSLSRLVQRALPPGLAATEELEAVQRLLARLEEQEEDGEGRESRAGGGG